MNIANVGSIFSTACAELIFLYVVVESVLCLFFFFQAEDGIRDLIVTGVQTCALPIWVVANRADRPYVGGRGRDWVKVKRQRSVDCVVVGLAGELATPRLVLALRHADRSEERRVGKECRSRWSPYH